MGERQVVLPSVPFETVDDWFASGGGDGLRAAHRLGADATVDEIAASGLRGRGGGGFPTGAKWASIREAGGGEHFVVVNGAEGEPASFKDRALMRRDPYRVIEGAAIAAFCVGARRVFVATKASFAREIDALGRAATEMSELGLLDDLEIALVEGPDEYLFGEEKALLEVIEGNEPLPRQLPPWQHGLFATVEVGWEAGTSGSGDEPASNPTLVNNVETLMAAAHVLARGADWYRSMGTAESRGTIVTTVVGDVASPGVREIELGTPLAELLDLAGGPLPGRTFKAAFSGVSNEVLAAADLDVPLTYEDLVARGSGLGAAGFVVYDDTANMVEVARELSRFLAVESCGQCPPCKQGSLGLTERLTALRTGDASEATLGEMRALLRTVTDANRCALGTGEQRVVSSVLRAFPDDVAAHLDRPPFATREIVVPKIVDIADDGSVTYDRRHLAKRPDWTYE